MIGQLVAISSPGLPALVAAAGERASMRFIEFFTANIRNPHAADLFLSWVTGTEGRQYYVRQRRDVKLTAFVETYDAEMLAIYSKMCGLVLARAHAKAGDPWAIAGYLGKNDRFDEAMGKFALAYADQAERDHMALQAAVRAGIVEVQVDR
jgi:hypothetical protein